MKSLKRIMKCEIKGCKDKATINLCPLHITKDPFFVAFGKFRHDLRQLLWEVGIGSNPGWTEDDIVNAFRKIIKKRK